MVTLEDGATITVKRDEWERSELKLYLWRFSHWECSCFRGIHADTLEEARAKTIEEIKLLGKKQCLTCFGWDIERICFRVQKDNPDVFDLGDFILPEDVRYSISFDGLL